MTPLITGLLGGLLGSAHCLGMCGGFATALGAAPLPMGPIVARQLAYSAGRMSTYMFLGVLAATLGLYLSQYRGSLIAAQQVLSVTAGLAMLLIGLSVLRPLRRRWRGPGPLTRLLAPVFKSCLNARSLAGFWTVGLINGLLPCGLVYAFLALAASTADLGAGALLMAGFGVGTMPAMVSIGCGARLLSQPLRRHVHRAAAVVVVIMGCVTIVRGLPRQGAHACCEHAAAPALPLERGSERQPSEVNPGAILRADHGVGSP